MLEPTWFFADGEVHCFSHAQMQGIKNRLTRSEIRTQAGWEDPLRPFMCHECDRRQAPRGLGLLQQYPAEAA